MQGRSWLRSAAETLFFSKNFLLVKQAFSIGMC